jgi:iron complex transport system ATP-binding protein
MKDINSILSTNNLSIGYKEKHKPANVLIGNINFSIFPGDFVCLVGPNGCGKSTLLRTLTGIQKPISGEVLINGKEISVLDRQELSKEISIVLTESFGMVNASVNSIVSLGRYPHNNWLGILRDEDLKIIKNVLQVTGLSSYINKNILELSDGIRQKVMIARALVQDTPLILLDEPTAFLDAPSKLEIIHMLRSLAKQFNKSIILSSHDLDLALQSSDLIMLITKEQKIEIDTPEDLVLNGHFEAAFNKEDVKFSLQKGIFKMNSTRKIKLQVMGDKTETFWTERALERIGISTEPDYTPDGSVTIVKNNGKLEWHLDYNSQKNIFDSIGGLLKHF